MLNTRILQLPHSILDRLNLQTCDPLKVAAIVREECEIILKRRRTNKQIHITDDLTSSAKPTTFASEHTRSFFICV